MKYRILTDQTKIVNGHILHRIQRISDDALGGWIESEHNLSQEGDCWVANEACVYGDARVLGSAQVSDWARVCDSAMVDGNAKISGYAHILDSSSVFGSAHVFDEAAISGMSRIHGSAQVYGFSRVFRAAQVYDAAQVYGSAKVYNDAEVFGSAIVCGDVRLQFGEFTSDCRTDHAAVIRCSIARIPFVDGKIILYKRVNKTDNPNVWVSCYDQNFKYYKGRARTVKNPDLRWEASCVSGLHLSHADYWDDGNALIACEVELKDIICVQEGKVRCWRISKVLGAVS